MDERCRLLEWDTRHFGVRIGRIDGGRLRTEQVADVTQWIARHEIACMYFLADVGDDETVRAAEQLGAHLVDVRVTLTCRSTTALAQSQVRLRSGCTDDVDAFRAVAEAGYQDSRFFFDRNFAPEKCRELYQLWLSQSFAGSADEVRVATIDERPVAFVTCHLRNDRQDGEIGLVGVSPDVRGAGVGRAIILDALSWFAEHGVRETSVATQSRNIAAQRLYQACGFRTASVGLWYHWWAR